MNFLQNLDLLTVGVTVAATVLLGFSVYISDTKSATNRTFFYFSLVSALWGSVNYLSYQFADPTYTLWLLRIVIFFGAFQAFFLYLLFTVFPNRDFTISKSHTYILATVITLAAVSALSPFAFEGIAGGVKAGLVSKVITGPGIILFGALSVGLVLAAIVQLINKILTSLGSVQKALYILLGGISIMFILIIVFNLIIPNSTGNTSFIPYGALFTFPFILAAAYVILQIHLFNIKIIGTSVLVFLLSIVSFADIIFSTNIELILFRIGVFILVLVFGINLIRGVLREVRQREKIEILAKALEETNERQENLIHFISHEVKGFLARYMGAFSGMVDGDYGPLPDGAKSLVTDLLPQSRKDSKMVIDLLQASNLKKGTVSYQMVTFNCMESLEGIISKLKPSAEAKGLSLQFSAEGDPAQYIFTGDQEKLSDHVFQNLIENSINYTPTGSITVTLQTAGDAIQLIVTDTGIGITDEDKARLFTEGGHGKDSSKVNVHSTGYGLYIARQVVLAHKGKIWAESDGSGKGSRFIVELPRNSATIAK